MPAPDQAARTRRAVSPTLGIAKSLGLIAVAVAAPKVFHWQVNALHLAPLSVR